MTSFEPILLVGQGLLLLMNYSFDNDKVAKHSERKEYFAALLSLLKFQFHQK